MHIKRTNANHKISVIFGPIAVSAYLNGERNVETLRLLSDDVRHYEFTTIQELNAFIIGIEEATGLDDAIAVDDLLR